MSGINGAASISSAIQQAAIRSEIGIAVMAKQIDALQQQGDAAIAMLESASQVMKDAGIGVNFNSRA
jgi:hypothetical protein